MHKKIKCQYPSAPRSYVQKKSSSSASSPAKVRHARQRSLATTVDTTVSSCSSSSASSEDESLPSATTTTVTSPVLQQQHHLHHHNESTTTFESSGSSCGSSSGNSQQELGLFFDMADFITTDSSSAANTLLSDDFMDMDQLNAMVPWHQQPFTFSPNNTSGNNNGGSGGVGKACAPWNDMPELDDIDFSSGSNTASSSVTPLPATPSVPEQQPQCSCFVQAVGTHESIEVARWGLKELSGDVDEILQQLNKALVECEELLECRRCNVQPSYVMLLLNMCSKMLASLEDISIGTSRLGGSSCHSDRSITTSSSSSTTPSSASSASSSMFRSADGKRRRCASDGADRTGENGNGSNESRRREIGISIRNWQLDDDDEHLVLQSLIRARVARLERLLGMLGRVVSENSWPAHGGMMRELQGRLTRGAFGGGVVGGAGGLLGGNPAWQGGLGQTLF
mgnify:CR=1 FL=1